MRTPDYIIKIAADSVERLRQVDVFRVLDNCSDEERKPTARYIVAAHPEFAGEINEYWNDVLPMEEHTKDEDCIVSPDTLGCVICGVDHSDSCPECSAKGFHTDECSLNEAHWPAEHAADCDCRHCAPEQADAEERYIHED